MRRPLLTKSAWLGRVALMVILAPFTMLWGELFTKMLLPQNVDSQMNIFVSDPLVGFTYIPNSKTYEKGREYNAPYEINELGLRDREYGAKKDGVFRVLLLGDSFSVSHGLPIEESLSRQLESALQEIVDSDGRSVKLEVINGAVGGYSPYNYWRAYRRLAPMFSPDVVIVGLSPDDYDCSNENTRIGEQEAVGEFSIRRLRKWLSWNSEFYVLMRNFLYYNDVVGRITLSRDPAGGVDNQLEPYMAGGQRSASAVWSKSFSYLQNLRKDTAADDVKLTLIRIPLKMEIDPVQHQKVSMEQGMKNEPIDLDQPLRAISAFCDAEGIPLLDPRPALRERHATTPCYFVYDGHWNAEGVRAAAASLARQWHNLGLPPWGVSGGRLVHR